CRNSLFRSAPEEIETHLEPIEQVAIPVAEPTQHPSKAVDPLLALDNGEHGRGESFPRSSIARLRIHRGFTWLPTVASDRTRGSLGIDKFSDRDQSRRASKQCAAGDRARSKRRNRSRSHEVGKVVRLRPVKRHCQNRESRFSNDPIRKWEWEAQLMVARP